MKSKQTILIILLSCYLLSNDIELTSDADFSKIPLIVMPYIDNEDQLLKDKLNDKPGPIKFAEKINVNFNTSNSGKWFEYNQTFKVWKLHILSEDAIGLKLLFDEFHLSENSKLFIYNDNQEMIIGPINHEDNNIDSSFGHRLLKGSSIFIEYFVPNSYNGEHLLQISDVIHAYRDIHGYYEGRDRDCGDNVACSDADPYENQINSVIFLEMYQYICSAALVNNTSQDLTPYVLTAYHCVEDDGSLGGHNYFTFYFKHQSSSCSGSSGNYGYSRDGSYIRSWGTMNSSDFALLEMDDDPPSYFDPYFAGWSRSTSSPQISVGIHHPGGNAKKINYDNNDTAYSCGWYSNNTHWCFSWDDGGTEGGSSGSPVFNNNNQIVGQLSGGTGECGNGTDYYGKISKSWSNGSNSSSRLKDWLDPENTNVYTLDGTYDGVADSDGDGVDDDQDSNDNNQYICSDNDNDTCDDCSSGTYNTSNDGADYDGDGLCDAGDSDDDNDGASDWEDSNDYNPYICSDDDNDTCDDCSSGYYNPENDGCDLANIGFQLNAESTNELAIEVQHQIPIAGFQFNIVDNPNCINIVSAFGGEAENEGYTVTTSEPGEYGIVLGFSMTGASISPGNHILTNLIYSGTGDCEACIDNVTLTDESGTPLVINIGSCISIENSLIGDINYDGVINVIDVVIIVNIILDESAYNSLGDMNGDGGINVQDIVLLMGIILNG